MRYEILIRKGRKVIERHQRDTYWGAMRLLDILTESVQNTGYTVEYKDTNPFNR